MHVYSASHAILFGAKLGQLPLFVTVHRIVVKMPPSSCGRSFTLFTTQAAARLTAAEQSVFQQTAALPRLYQNAVCRFTLPRSSVLVSACHLVGRGSPRHGAARQNGA